jgi:hypothetical protein
MLPTGKADWPRCKVRRCLGLQLRGGWCLAHTDEAQRASTLATLKDGADLSFTRGVPIDSGLLMQILANAPRNKNERIQLRNADFRRTKFTDPISLAGAIFEGQASFEDAIFMGNAFLQYTVFQDLVWFFGTKFKRIAVFGSTVFKAGLRRTRE